MKQTIYIYGGNQEPEAEDITSILSLVGMESDVNKAKEIVQAIDGREMKDLIDTETFSQAKIFEVPKDMRIQKDGGCK